MNKMILLALSSALIFTACSKPNSSAEGQNTGANSAQTPSEANASENNTAPSLNDTVETSLDWAGEYKGIFPCADCEGIQMELELKADKTYELKEKYLGKGDGNEFKTEGSFSFDSKNPSIITLGKADQQRKFFIGENFAEARDIQTGEAIDSKLNYKLTKENH